MPDDWRMTADEWRSLVATFGAPLVYGCGEAQREHRLHVVISSRALRVLNPWAVWVNASSFVGR